MNNIAQKCIEWNAQRFERKYDYAINAKLLIEETSELFDAPDHVEMMDAVGDIAFVAMGLFWKIGFSVEHVHAIMTELDMRTANMAQCHQWTIQVEEWVFEHIDPSIPAVHPGLSLATHCLFITALGVLRGAGLQHEFYNIVDAICDSNNTKAIKKTSHTEKANINKGDTYVPPTKRLIDIACSNGR